MPTYAPTAPPSRPIHNLLIANRSEIATRILSSARTHDPPIKTFTLSTQNDTAHTLHSTHTITLPAPSSYLDISHLLALLKQHKITTIHPGYGLLSESASFASRAWNEAGAVVLGPGSEILERTGDKLAARRLAAECGVPVLPATESAILTSDLGTIHAFAAGVGLPVMLKAVDGGGGRGIRLVRHLDEIEDAVKRAIAESPSKAIFIEKAAIDGFRHVEVQILGDGVGGVRHLWERECSVQRRYQKIVEVAPSTVSDRALVKEVICAAESMATELRYRSLGTFEFLVKPETREWFFLEVNPRLQVEHTVTEEVCGVDLVEAQFLIAEGRTVEEVLPLDLPQDPERPPSKHSIQLRVCAENPAASFSLSIGKISAWHFPTGKGIRVDTALVYGHEATVSADFDSLIAKIIVTASSWEAAVRTARRALQDSYVSGVQTNLSVLRAIVASEDFENRRCDTAWFEKNQEALVQAGRDITKKTMDETFFTQAGNAGSSGPAMGSSTSTVLFRKGDAWTIKLAPTESQKGDAEPESESHHLRLEKVLRNDFPSLLNAQIAYASPAHPEPRAYNITLNATSGSSASTMVEGKHRRGDSGNDSHVVIPYPGKLVEVLVDEGDMLKKGDIVCIVQQMKMELEVRCKKAGRVSWVMEVEDGEDVAEGDLAVEIEDEDEARPKL